MKTRSGQKVKLTSYDELLAVPTIDGAMDISLDQLHEFKNHPFFVCTIFEAGNKSRPNRPHPLFLGLANTAKSVR